jgi:hypothetical protein
MAEVTGSIGLGGNEEVFHAGLFHLIGPALRILEGGPIDIDHFEHPVGLLVGLPDDPLVTSFG